jgi:hypothetical protein
MSARTTGYAIGSAASAGRWRWSGKSEFESQELRQWKVGGKKAAMVRNAGLFTFLTIEGAGHMVSFFIHGFVGGHLTRFVGSV